MTVAPETSVLSILVCTLPTASIPDDVDVEAIGTSFAKRLESLDRGSFTLDAIWRNTFSLTGTMRAFYSPGRIAAAWTELTHLRQARSFAPNPRFARVIQHGSCQRAGEFLRPEQQGRDQWCF